MAIAPLKIAWVQERLESWWEFLFWMYLIIIITRNYESTSNLTTHEHHLIKGSRVITVGNLGSINIYSMLILNVQNKPSSNIYFKNLFSDNDIDNDITGPQFIFYHA